jgi:hypothetical protein
VSRSAERGLSAAKGRDHHGKLPIIARIAWLSWLAVLARLSLVESLAGIHFVA